MAQLRLVSVNIERSKHLPLVEAFVEAQQPDVVCIQELMEPDCDLLAAAFGATHHLFAPMSRLTAEYPGMRYGVGIFSRLPVGSSGMHYYVRTQEALPEIDPILYAQDPNKEHRMVLWCDAEKDGETFRIATTHFTWTPDGSASDTQRRDAASLLAQLGEMGEFVLAGDFNAPRTNRDGTPGEIFGMLAARYRDNIPTAYATSIDGAIHRAGPIPLMVDGLFSTPSYRVSDVTLHTGVSDHCAITATVERV